MDKVHIYKSDASIFARLRFYFFSKLPPSKLAKFARLIDLGRLLAQAESKFSSDIEIQPNSLT